MDRVVLQRGIRAEVLMLPGKVHPADVYAALEIYVDGIETPYHFILQLPVIGYKELVANGVDPQALYETVAAKINGS